MDYFLPSIKDRFEISEQHLTGPGSSFQFLRRTYEETETGLKVNPGKCAESVVEMYEEKMGRAKVPSLPCSQEMLEADGTTQLRPDLAGLYRSLVGCGIYLSQERLDVSYVIKELAGSMSCPTTGSLKKL
ncbi:Retrovirus-related Pol polyprotein from transposon TNT 1-94, partial [Durusdinium trenchii]